MQTTMTPASFMADATERAAPIVILAPSMSWSLSMGTHHTGHA
jgi:hypothetical protein